VTINGVAFEHLIYHYRLAYSGWQYAQIIQGGESFVALSDLNRIEKCWAWLKSRIRKLLRDSDHLRDAMEAVLKQATS